MLRRDLNIETKATQFSWLISVAPLLPATCIVPTSISAALRAARNNA